MYICYIDESGVQEEKGGGSHFILAGFAILSYQWKDLDQRINNVKINYGLNNIEIHTGWMLRRYIEQEKIRDFSSMDWSTRRQNVIKERNINIRISAERKSKKAFKELMKNYRKTEPYIHLTIDERKQFLRDICDEVNTWEDARLFVEAYDKNSIPLRPSWKPSLFEEAFEQVISRFHRFLATRFSTSLQICGIIVQDKNQSVEKKLTDTMRKFHQEGTFWTAIPRIIETPLFVDSQLTSMVQVADLCAYATRRFFENGEDDLFNRIYNKFDKSGATVVGIRHFTPGKSCRCKVCVDHYYT